MIPEQLRKMVDTFDQWRQITRKNYLNGQGVYDPNAAFIGFLLAIPSLNLSKIEIAELIAQLKAKSKIENPEVLRVQRYTDVEFEAAIKTVLAAEEERKNLALFDLWYQTISKDDFIKEGVYSYNLAFMAFLKDKNFKHLIENAAEAQNFAKTLNIKRRLENADALDLSSYTDEQLVSAIEESQFNLEEVREVAHAFEHWRNKQNRKDFFEPSLEHEHYSPKKALLLFVEKTDALKFIKNYAGFCQLAEYVKTDNKIDLVDELQYPPCSRGEFDAACEKRGQVVIGMLLGIMNDLRLQNILLVTTFFVNMYVLCKLITAKPTLDCWNGRFNYDKGLLTMTCETDSLQAWKPLFECIKADSTWEQSFLETGNPYVRDVQLWKDSISSHPDGSLEYCSLKTFWTCASKQFDGNYTNYEALLSGGVDGEETCGVNETGADSFTAFI